MFCTVFIIKSKGIEFSSPSKPCRAKHWPHPDDWYWFQNISIPRILAKLDDGYPKHFDTEKCHRRFFINRAEKRLAKYVSGRRLWRRQSHIHGNNHNLLEHVTKPCKNVPTRFNVFSREANLPNQYVSDIMKPEHIPIYE